MAQKLGLNQVTYAEEILKVEDGKATIRRLIDGGVETVEAPLPLVITVNGSAAPCRPCNVKLVMKYKYATCPMERKGDEPWANLYEERPYLTLNQWSVADVDGDPAQCGLSGSPTKVKAVKNIVFQAKESKTLTSSDANDKTAVEADLNALKEAIAKAPADQMTDAQVDEIKAAKEKLMNSAQKLFSKVYEQAQAAQGAAGAQGQAGPQAGQSASQAGYGDDVVDGDYKEV